MRRVLVTALVGLAISLVVGSAAHAARMMIPCTGESIVKVLDVPPTPETMFGQGASARKIDLGYKFTYCFVGDWVGYIGSDSEYVSIDEAKIKTLLIAAGVRETPDPPWLLAAPDVQMMLLMALGAGLLAGIAHLARTLPGQARRGRVVPISQAPAAPSSRLAAAVADGEPFERAATFGRRARPQGR